MKIAKSITIILLLCFSADMTFAQMIRNRAVHFKRHRVVHHHHKK